MRSSARPRQPIRKLWSCFFVGTTPKPYPMTGRNYTSRARCETVAVFRVPASIVCVYTRHHQQPEQGKPLRHFQRLPLITKCHERDMKGQRSTYTAVRWWVSAPFFRDDRTLQALHRCTNYAESVPVEHESPQAPSDRPDKPKTIGEEKGVETITQQGKPVQSLSTASQSKAEPKRWSKKEQPRKGLFSFLRK